MSTQQDRFWRELVQLRAHIDYLSLYRQQCEKLNRGADMFLAIASSGSIAAWAVWREFSMLWGAIIALSHLLTAVKSHLPFEKRLAATSDLTSRFEVLFVRWEAGWQQVAGGELKEQEIADRLFVLKKAKIDIQEKSLKGVSLPDNSKLQSLATKRAESYFTILYPLGDLYEQRNEGRLPVISTDESTRGAWFTPDTSERANASGYTAKGC
jgi:hypothetical protein